MFSKYYSSVKFLESLSNITRSDYMKSKGCSFYLKRANQLIKELNIDLNQFKFIHIAGTAGKGTTVAMMHNILRQASHNVGSFYSPHPTTSIERIKVNDKYINPNTFADIMNTIKPVLEKMLARGKRGIPSYFEIFFAISLIYFSRTECEYVILETGCGGEFDATNIIKKPIITAITNIGLDHTRLLGNTLTKIATTKSKIIKPKSKFFTTETNPKLLKIFRKECKIKQIKFINCHRLIHKDAAMLHLYQDNPPYINQSNTLLVSTICHESGISNQHINQGINNTKLSCRFEIIQTKPTVVLDGAHNNVKINSTIHNLKNIKYNNLFLVLAINQNKNVKSIIKSLSYKDLKYKKIYLTRHSCADRACANPKLMYNLFLKNKLKIKPDIFIDPWQALNSALKQAKSNDLILVTGSFYLAGELRKHWITEEKILKNNT